VQVPGGLETPLGNTEKTPLSKTGGAKSGAFPTENDAIDADLQAVIDAWPDLPTAIRAAMLAMVNAAVNR